MNNSIYKYLKTQILPLLEESKEVWFDEEYFFAEIDIWCETRNLEIVPDEEKQRDLQPWYEGFGSYVFLPGDL